MANGLGGTVLPQIQHIFRGGTLAGMTDGQLLERFATRNDNASFEALLGRHGPLVLTVCRNLLRDRDDVDDAFQATFFVLVRKAGTIRIEDSLGPWLYAVAYRVATRARANRALRITRENLVAEWKPRAPSGDLDGHDVSPLLHQELARLPERLRAPIILCYFQGQTHEMAAQQLQWPVGTVRSRMARARALLRDRLTRKGVVLSAGCLLPASDQATAAILPHALSEATIQAAMRIAASRTVMAGVLSTQAYALMEGVLNAMWITKLKLAAGAATVVGLISTAVVALAVQLPADTPEASDPTTLPRVDNPGSASRDLMSSTYPKTYYIGDIITNETAGAIRPSALKASDFFPLLELLTTTVAPGTWRIVDEDGGDLSKRFKSSTSNVRGAGSPEGSITPFYRSVSLIIRHTAEVHDKLAVLLLQLRHLVHQRNAKTDASHRTADNPATPPAADPSAALHAALEKRLRKHEERLHKLVEDFKRDVDSGAGNDLSESERTARRTKWLQEFQRGLGEFMGEGNRSEEVEGSSLLPTAVASPD